MNEELNGQREQSHTSLNSAESRMKKSEAQLEKILAEVQAKD